MELHSLNLELRALRSLTDVKVDKHYRLSLLGRLNAKHFGVDPTRNAFVRLQRLAREDGELPDWEALCEDPRLNEEARELLRDEDGVKPVLKKHYDKFARAMGKYSKRRALLAISRMINDGLKEKESEDFDEEDLHARIIEGMQNIGRDAIAEAKIYGFGAGQRGSGLKLAKQVLDAPKEKLYLTGLTEYDQRNFGLPTTGVVLLAATTSGGKSAVSMNIGHDMAMLNGIAVSRITLEMTAEQETKRYMSAMSGVEFNKIKNATLTRAEKRRIYNAMEKIDRDLEKAGGAFKYTSPPRGMTMDDVLYMTAANNDQVTIIDYIGLLEDIDTNNQAATLSEAVRKAKIHATQNQRLYIILVQLDSESGKVRYSRGMNEHADVLITWSYVDAEVRATHELPMEVEKARDGELFGFLVAEDFATMSAGARAAKAQASRGDANRDDMRRERPEAKDDDAPTPKKKKRPAGSGDRERFSRKPKDKPKARGFGELELSSVV